MELQNVRMQIPEGANLILGHSHFIKTAEDLYEVVVNTVPGAKFAVAFCEASGPCLIRVEANDDELRNAAVSNGVRKVTSLCSKRFCGSARTRWIIALCAGSSVSI